MYGAVRSVAATTMVVAAAVFAISTAGASSAPTGSDTGLIAFAAPGSDQNIFTIKPDGTDLRKLTSNGRSPVWSPDRSRLIFSRRSRGAGGYQSDLYTIRWDGSEPRLVIRDAGYAAWSPDGQSIAFLRDGLWTVRLDGSHKRRLVEGDVDDPTWSPDGRWIAFTWYGNLFYEVWLVHPDGTGLRRLAKGRSAEVENPSWAPGGRRVSVVGLFDDEGLYIADLGGHRLRRIATSSGTNEWSPVGQRILFRHDHLEREPDGLWTTRPDGRDQTRLALRISDPDWSPDGSKIAFLRRGKIIVMNSDGTHARQVSKVAARGLDWDGR